jgi:dienelactone hydrolase
VGEAVLHAAVQVDAPIDSCRPHLLLERVALLGRDQRVVSSDAHEHRAADVARLHSRAAIGYCFGGTMVLGLADRTPPRAP